MAQLTPEQHLEALCARYQDSTEIHPQVRIDGQRPLTIGDMRRLLALLQRMRDRLERSQDATF